MNLLSVNPATEEIIAQFAPYSDAQVGQILDQARHAFVQWRAVPLIERGALLQRVAGYLRTNKASLAPIATQEMGKPITEAEAEVEKCAWNCDYFAENAERFLADQHIASHATQSYVAFRPLGVILAVMPWNYPYWQVFRCVAPALMAGNTVVLKHASNVSGVALEIERIFQECGLPRGVFSTVLVPGAEMEHLIADPRIAAVTLTGSVEVGASVASISGRALKKTVLELGGSDAFIVLADADLDQAAQAGVAARFMNAGQSCIAAKRFIVVESVAEAFAEKFVQAASKLRIGDPLNSQTQLGPLARAELRDTLEKQIQSSIEMGAHVLLGGKPLAGKGYFYSPTVVTNVTPEMPMFSEETFGPAAALIRARDAEQALALANASDFGLSSNLWTRDIAYARELAARIEAGGVFINGVSASDPRIPFGGIKKSGIGRELSTFGIQEFVNIQTVWVGPAKK